MSRSALAAHHSLNSIWLHGSNANFGSTTITIPTDIKKGDLIVFYQYAGGTFGTPSYVDPGDNFVTVGGAVGPTWSAASLHVKIADGTESGATITGMNGSWNDDKIVAVFRGNRPFVKVRWATGSFIPEMTDGNPAAQVISSAAALGPIIALALMSSRSSISPRTATPAMQGEIDTGSNNANLLYHCMVGDYHDITVDMDDEGSNQSLMSGFLELSCVEDRAVTAAFQNSSSSTTTSVTTPSTIQPGDALFLFDRASNGSGTPSSVTDTDWDLLTTLGVSPHRYSIYGKIANESDVSASVAGSTGDTTNHHAVLVVRGERPFQMMNTFSPVSVGPVSTDPAAVVVVDETSLRVRLHLALFSSSGAISPRTVSPAATGEISPTSAFYASYTLKDAGAALADTSYNMDDEGTGNTILAIGVGLR